MALNDMYIWATTDNESQAAGITQRLLDEGADATYWEVSELEETGYPVRSAFKYAVLRAKQPYHYI